MIDNDYAYYYRRAEAELQQAQQATHSKAAAAHHLLAEAYLERVSSLASKDAVGGGVKRRESRIRRSRPELSLAGA